MVQHDLFMVKQAVDLFAKRFRSKAFSAASLPLGYTVAEV